MPRPRKSRPPDPPPQAGRPDYVESFPPSIGADCRVLILGSMPGVRSLAAAQYYAHPQNLFWPMMQAVFGVQHSLAYVERMAGLHACGVGLWDVLQGCERRGSLDSAIDSRSEVPNAIAALLQQRHEIRTVAFNGAKAAQAFARHVAGNVPAGRLRELELLAMPSTSPAHASMSREEKRQRWSMLAQIVQRR
jgi:double-stranded uracil-DNA glycosylase